MSGLSESAHYVLGAGLREVAFTDTGLCPQIRASLPSYLPRNLGGFPRRGCIHVLKSCVCLEVGIHSCSLAFGQAEIYLCDGGPGLLLLNKY